MRTYEVTEVELSDWEELRTMSLKKALEILEDDRHLDGYMGSYEYGSTDEYDFEKAKIMRAIDKVCEAARKAVNDEAD